jgi:hypothetical protein
VRVAVLKLEGVETVDVSLERALADLRPRPGNHVTIQQLRTLIKRNGFNPGSATVEVAGRLTMRSGLPAIAVTNTDLVLPLIPDPSGKDAMQKAQERASSGGPQNVLITGVLVQGTPAEGDHIELRSIEALPDDPKAGPVSE